MRIAQILEATIGGTARHVVDLCLGLRRAGHEVHLIHNPRQGRVDAIFRAGLPRLRDAGVVEYALDMPRSVRPSDLSAILEIRRYLRENGPFDIVHGHSSKGGAYGRLAALGLPGRRVYTPNALMTTNPELGRASFLAYDVMERVLARLNHVFIAVSEEERAEGLRLGVSADRMFLVTNGTDVAPAPTFTRAELGLPPEAMVIGTVGRLVPQKATIDLVRAFARVAERRPDVVLAIVGTGPLERQVKGEVELLGVGARTHWLGSIDGPAAMATFDIFALSSLYEGFPYVLIEAMNRGLPIVTTAVGGAATLIDDPGNGLVVPVQRVDLLEAALAKLVDDDQLRRTTAARSLERAPIFSAQRMVDETLRVYEAAITSE